jgi:hypothetical protein
MFLGDSIVFWLCAVWFVASISLILLERIRKELNRTLPKEKTHGGAQARIAKVAWPTSPIAFSLNRAIT